MNRRRTEVDFRPTAESIGYAIMKTLPIEEEGIGDGYNHLTHKSPIPEKHECMAQEDKGDSKIQTEKPQKQVMRKTAEKGKTGRCRSKERTLETASK